MRLSAIPVVRKKINDMIDVYKMAKAYARHCKPNYKVVDVQTSKTKPNILRVYLRTPEMKEGSYLVWLWNPEEAYPFQEKMVSNYVMRD